MSLNVTRFHCATSSRVSFEDATLAGTQFARGAGGVMDTNDEMVDRGTAAVGAMILASLAGSVWGLIGLSLGYLIWG